MAVTGGGHAVHARTQASANSLKTVRYEESLPGKTPHQGSKPAASSPPVTGGSDATSSPSPSSSLCPCTASSPPHRRPQHSPIADSLTTERSSRIKRDSGIAPSVATTASSRSLPVPGGAARQPDLPTIILHDDDLPSAAATAVAMVNERSLPMGTGPGDLVDEDEPCGIPKSPSPLPVRHTMNFSGLDTAAADDINLNDLTSDKVTFSTRGSLLFGGKRMQELIAEKGVEVEIAPTQGSAGLDPKSVAEPSRKKETTREMLPNEQVSKQNSDLDGETPKQGLTAGRRKPSSFMLQAATQGGRVLSAEEITFSVKVRSMYDHGDERAANWTIPLDGSASGKTTPDLIRRNSATPDTWNGDLGIQKTRYQASRKSSINADPRSSFYSKDANEVAGGIEDWEDIDSRHVDRYGFIHFDRRVSGLSDSCSSLRQPATGMQRIATSLRVEAEQPRRDRHTKRGPSSVRSSRSVPPTASSGTFKKGPASMHSTYSASTSARSNPFRSRTQRALDDASDMLTLPPGLANIDEDEDAGTTASMLKQREWSREEKWRKMAVPVRLRTAAGKGGGMRFDFNINDPKLVERTWKGIPDRWRATAWHSFLSASAKRRNSAATDEELIGQFYKLQGISSADDIQIDIDVPRTINMHVMFRKRYRGGQRLLFRVLHAVSLYFPETGYVQGMAALAVTLLCYYEEELAFVMMVRLWQLRGLDQLFESGFEGLLTCLKEFETQWLRGGDVAIKLNELGIDSTAWGTRWYLTLFNMSVPFPAQLRVWDVFMLLGDSPSANGGAFGGADLDVLHSISAALIDATREILLDSDFENAMKVLTSFMPIKDEDLLMTVANAEYRLKKKKRDGVKV